MWETRIISPTVLERGYMDEWQRAFMKKFNENPTFNNEDKPYNFIKPVKTNTNVHGWIFEYNDKLYVATQLLKWRGPESVLIYNATKKGEFKCTEEIADIPLMCDIETAVDQWVAGKNNKK